MDLRSLNSFIQVAEMNSFTRAAEKLGFSQPTISFQIKQLEKDLGVQLFERIGHTVKLTDAGSHVLQYAQKICRMSQEMALEPGRKLEPTGEIRIGIVTDGEGEVLFPGGSLHVQRGSELFFPHDAQEITLQGSLTMVMCHPAGAKMQ